jgi:4-hydroxy-tetrahydrodipicolinate synthase
MFKGSLVALITPMRADGSVDRDAYSRLIEWQIAQGTHGLVTVGTTGESPTLSHQEHRDCIALAVEVAAHRVPVIAGTGSNSTAEAIALTGFARDAGADAALVVTPYYNKPTQQGLFLHYSAIADAVELPILIYNIPPRSVVDMSVATMARLATHRNIVGVKDSTANLARPLLTRLACGPDFCQLSGEDATAVAFLGAGGAGCISVTGNVAPALCAQVQTLWQSGDVAGAIALQDRLMPLHEAMFLESNPAPVKYAASLLGFGTPACRLPLAGLAAETETALRGAMTQLGLLGP